ncbi:hypothetical protein [uncultured Modestobacter sp.]|uniref:hypothetical protein n=1 Tax=uncultured Modestobacter sp. TaxID=380048 RepID=UPI002610E74A|nr:hypothetical protein [uncultured Modestobacter sp.]
MLVVAAMIGGTTTPARAAWQAGASVVSGSLTMAQVGSRFAAVAGRGAVAANGASWSITGLATAATGYVDLVNASTVPARLSLTVTAGTLVGVSPAAVCSQPWNTTTGACPGTATQIGLAMVLGTSTGGHSTEALLPVAGRVHLKASVTGVLNTVTLTAADVVPRPAGDRTTS